MDEAQDGQVPGWHWAVAIAALLFEVLGCVAYVLQVRADPAALTLDQRALADATPMWITAAYAIAVWVGLAGAVGLLLRRRWSASALLVSALAVVVQFGGIFIVPDLRAQLSSDQLLGPVLIFVMAYAFWQYALIARNRGWLR